MHVLLWAEDEAAMYYHSLSSGLCLTSDLSVLGFSCSTQPLLIAKVWFISNVRNESTFLRANEEPSVLL